MHSYNSSGLFVNREENTEFVIPEFSDLAALNFFVALQRSNHRTHTVARIKRGNFVNKWKQVGSTCYKTPGMVVID